MAKKAEEKKIIVAKAISRLEFIDMIKGQIELANKSIKQSEHYIKTYVDLYQKTELDKCRYNLKYYVVGDGLTYERVSRKKIGF